jgi:Protein of unknown function (DUF3592)
MKPRWVAILLIGFMLLGVVFLIVSVKQLVDIRRFLAKAVGADAQVVGVARHVESVQRGSGDHAHYEDVPYYYPVVRFVTPLEEVVQFEGGDGSTKPEEYRVGESLKILYDPANPHDARLDTVNSRWGGVIIFGGLGVGFVVTSASVYLVWPVAREGRPRRRGLRS